MHPRAAQVGATAPVCSVIVPVRDGGAALGSALAALEASQLARDSWELIVVDDGSTDDSHLTAARYCDTVVRLGELSFGPAYARNRGAELARGAVLVFVDADVIVQPDTLGRMLGALEQDPTLGAVSAVLSPEAQSGGTLSRYRNLVLRHTQLTGTGDDAFHFWGGCAAVRRGSFMEAGAFNEWNFSRPHLEDLEFGLRLRSRGERIRRLPDLPVRHEHVLGMRELLVGTAWAHGTISSRLRLGMPSDGRVRASADRREILGELLALGAVSGAVAALLSRSPVALGLALALLALWLAFAAPLFLRLAREGGVLVLLAGLPVHLLSQSVQASGRGTGWMLRHLIGDPRPDPTVEAYAEVGLKTWPPVPTKRRS